MRHPFQCLSVCSGTRFENRPIIFAACGYKIVTIQVEDSTLLSSWPDAGEPKPIENVDRDDPEGPPGKKRKLSDSPTSLPTVIRLVISHDQRHLVAVTAEDKCLRVFEIEQSGRLQELSQRCMPKRPCALILSDDGSSILCGDKFGDVYSLPLLPTEEELEAPATEGEETQKQFKPAASHLTVHSMRNRKALEHQMKSQQLAKSREPLKFAHKLLLGHVSMLTDLTSSTVHKGLDKVQRYLFTSDRDEHIRISRAPPQSHIIEGFCFGHKEFVSKLCVTTPEILVSGGGDDDLFVWDWQECQLLQKINIKESVSSLLSIPKDIENKDVAPNASVAVTGIWAFKHPDNSKVDILATCEGVPTLIRVPLEIEGKSVTAGLPETIALTGNPLDVVISDAYAIVSVDTCHEAGSTEVMKSIDGSEKQLLCFKHDSNEGLKLDEKITESLEKAARHVHVGLGEGKALWELLYSMENLRKCAGVDADADD